MGNSFDSNFIRKILLTRNGDIWIGTMSGLYKYNTTGNGFEIFKNIPTDNESLNNDVIYSLLEDRAGLIWVGTYLGGINKIDPTESRFKKYTDFFLSDTHSDFNNILSVSEDETGNVWLSTSRGLLEINKKYLVTPQLHNNIIKYFEGEKTNAILSGPNQSLWVSTRNGIYLKERTGKFENQTRIIENQTGTKVSGFSVGLIDSDGNAWLSASNGFIRYDPNTRKYRFIKFQNKSGETQIINIICCIESYSGDLITGTTTGKLFRFDRHSEKLEQIILFNEKSDSMTFSKIFSVYETNPGILWLGTNMGLYKFNFNDKDVKRFLDTDGLSNNVIYSVLADNKGQIWCSTNSGVSVFIPDENNFRNYTYKDGLQSNEFNQGAYFKSKSGAFFLGGINGLNVFYPEIIIPNGYIPQVEITGLQINNEFIHPSKHVNILKKQMSEIDKLFLNYKQKNLSFEYCALSFSQPEKNRYKYKLQGYNDTWIDAGQKRIASYTNLNPGEYVFMVKGSNNDGKWNEKPATVEFIIRPPFWGTWYFQAVALLFLTFLIYLLFYLRLKSIKIQKKLLEIKVEEKTITLLEQKKLIENQNRELRDINVEIVAQNEKIKRKNSQLNEKTQEITKQRDNLLQLAENVKQANQAKLSFFTNISHELRTPLTLIISPLKELVSKNGVSNSKELSRKLKTIYLNSSKLLLIVNQLFDFRKVETDNMELKVFKFDLVLFV